MAIVRAEDRVGNHLKVRFHQPAVGFHARITAVPIEGRSRQTPARSVLLFVATATAATALRGSYHLTVATARCPRDASTTAAHRAGGALVTAATVGTTHGS